MMQVTGYRNNALAAAAGYRGNNAPQQQLGRIQKQCPSAAAAGEGYRNNVPQQQQLVALSSNGTQSQQLAAGTQSQQPQQPPAASAAAAAASAAANNNKNNKDSNRNRRSPSRTQPGSQNNILDGLQTGPPNMAFDQDGEVLYRQSLKIPFLTLKRETSYRGRVLVVILFDNAYSYYQT
jgi:hypothetical protein